jgi:predicted small metal-binding protein
VKSTSANNPGELNTDNKNSVYVGRHIIRNNDRPQRFKRSPDPMMECFHKNKEVFSKFEVNCEKALVIDGCFKTNKEVLQQTMIPEEVNVFNSYPRMSTIKKFDTAIKATIRKLKIQTLPKIEKDDLSYVAFNKKTYPGFFYSEYLGHKSKEEALPDAMKIAYDNWDKIHTASILDCDIDRNLTYPGTYAVGARNKRDYTYDDGEVLKSRAVHMPEFHNEIISGAWTDQISNHIKFNKQGPLYIGNSYLEYQRLYNDMADSNTILEGDFKNFDMRIWLSLKIMAIAIQRLYYDLDDVEIDNHFINIFLNIGIADYYTPGGYVYRMIHGLPSGVKSTTLSGSIINLLVQCHISRELPQKRIRYIIGGDDFLRCHLDKLSESQVDKIKENIEEINWKFKFLDEKWLDAKEINSRPYFYKYTIDRNEPVISTTTLLERTFIPWNKKYSNNYEVFKFLIDLLPSLAAPRSHFILFYQFLADFRTRFLKIETTKAEIFEMHSSIYRRVMKGEVLLKDHITESSYSCYNFDLKISSENKYNRFLKENKILKVVFDL